MSRPNRDGERGTVFVEALVATAIVALVLGVLFHAAGESAARRRGLEARRTALMIARSELEAVGTDIPLAPGDDEGRQGDYVWRASIQPETGGAGGDGGGVRLMRVSIAVRRDGATTPLASLSTLMFAPGAADGFGGLR